MLVHEFYIFMAFVSQFHAYNIISSSATNINSTCIKHKSVQVELPMQGIKRISSAQRNTE